MYAGVGWFCKIDGSIKEIFHKDILEDELVLPMNDVCNKLGFCRDQMIIQHANGPNNTPNLIKKYLSKQLYEVVEYPSQPPDLDSSRTYKICSIYDLKNTKQCVMAYCSNRCV